MFGSMDRLELYFLVKNVAHKKQALAVIHKSQIPNKQLNMKEIILPTDTKCKSQATE
jgi:hypothetical protein